MTDFNYEGVGVALPTPFDSNGAIDFLALEKIINHVIDGGVDYIVALGTTAETPTLTKEEKYKLTDFIREIVAGRKPMVIGIGGNNTKAVTIKMKSYDLRGYSAILSVTPYYNRPTQEGLFQHFKYISEESPLPIILYNVPTRTGVNLEAETTLRLANYSSKIVAIKEASGKVEQCKEIIKKAPKGFNLISGDDSSTYGLMQIGAKGVISVMANALPHSIVDFVKFCREKDSESALQCHKQYLPLLHQLFEEGNPSGLKALLGRMGLCENILRLPLVPVNKELEEIIIKEANSFIRR